MAISWEAVAKKLSRTIRDRRLLLNLSQADLARLAGLSLRRVQQIEAGENLNPSLKTIFRLADALTTDIAALLTYSHTEVARKRSTRPVPSRKQ